MNAKNIIDIMNNSDYEFYGLRKDDFDYKIGDACNVSHELYQDPVYDDDDELVYPYCEDGPYKGYYDAGELSGTSAIKISPDWDTAEVLHAIERMSIYFGNNLYLIGGNGARGGNDCEEIIIRDAAVIEILK